METKLEGLTQEAKEKSYGNFCPLLDHIKTM